MTLRRCNWAPRPISVASTLSLIGTCVCKNPNSKCRRSRPLHVPRRAWGCHGSRAIGVGLPHAWEVFAKFSREYILDNICMLLADQWWVPHTDPTPLPDCILTGFQTGIRNASATYSRWLPEASHVFGGSWVNNARREITRGLATT